jgi:epoxyqueuosine reductase
VAVRRPAPLPSFDELVELAREHGIEHLGVAPADVMERALAALRQRLADGHDAGMAFTFRNPERSTDPRAAVRDAQSVIVAARPYATLDEPPRPPLCGRVARYAWIDHYAPLRAGLRAIALRLRAADHRAVAYADDNALVDREVAHLGGLGWFGKNANLLVPAAGSFFVLGSVVTTAPYEAAQPVADGCGTCRRCLDGCPTGAIVAPGVVDGRRCLAWLLQRPGVFPIEHRAALGDRLYGCDECQEVCPPTVRLGARVTAPVAGGEAWVDVLDLLGASDGELLDRYGRWYVADRQPRWLRRNALIVLGNIGDGRDERVVAALRTALAAADPIVRAHAVWAARRLGRNDLLPAGDGDPLVEAELAATLG